MSGRKWLSHGQPGPATISGCPSKVLVVRTWNNVNNTCVVAGVDFHSWGMKIYGCPSDISIFDCPATFLVVPGVRTTKISNAAREVKNGRG